MTTDEVKKYFKRIEYLDCDLQLAKLDLEKLWSAVEYHSPTFDGAGGTHSGNDKMSMSISDIVEKEREMLEKQNAYLERYEKADMIVRSLDNYTMAAVMKMRYFYYMKWDEIAIRLHYSRRRITQLHGEALHIISLNVPIEV